MQNETVNAGAVLERIKGWLEIRSDSELAKELGVSPSTLSSWRQRNSIPYAACVEFALDRGIQLDWLILGRKGTAPFALGSKGESLDVDVLRLVVEELATSNGFILLPPEAISDAIAQGYEKYSDLMEDSKKLGITRDDLITIIQRVGKNRPGDAIFQLMQSEIKKTIHRSKKGPQ